MVDFHKHYHSHPYWRQYVYQHVPEEFHHLFDDYPSSLVSAADTISSGKRPFDRWYEYTSIQVWYEDNPDFVHLWFEDGQLVANNLDRKPEVPDCLNINIDDVWAYIQVGSYVVLDILDGIPLPDMLTGKVTS
ncbi:MAG: hypothetical protein AAGM36_19995 [Cyanobacteria bacterium J06597_1]